MEEPTASVFLRSSPQKSTDNEIICWCGNVLQKEDIPIEYKLICGWCSRIASREIEKLEHIVTDNGSGRIEIYVDRDRNIQGWRIHYDKFERIRYAIHYVNRREHGFERRFYKSGEIASETRYKNGFKHGWDLEFLKPGRFPPGSGAKEDDEDKKLSIHEQIKKKLDSGELKYPGIDNKRNPNQPRVEYQVPNLTNIPSIGPEYLARIWSATQYVDGKRHGKAYEHGQTIIYKEGKIQYVY